MRATMRSPMTPSDQVCTNAVTASTTVMPTSSEHELVEPGSVAGADHLTHQPADDERQQQAGAGADEQRHDCHREELQLRAQVAEEPAPGHAGQARDAALPGAHRRRRPTSLAVGREVGPSPPCRADRPKGECRLRLRGSSPGGGAEPGVAEEPRSFWKVPTCRRFDSPASLKAET